MGVIPALGTNSVLLTKYMYMYIFSPTGMTSANIQFCQHGSNLKFDFFFFFFRTALHLACAQGKEDIVKLLLENNAKTNLCDNYGRTPLMKVSTVLVILQFNHWIMCTRVFICLPIIDGSVLCSTKYGERTHCTVYQEYPTCHFIFLVYKYTVKHNY